MKRKSSEKEFEMIHESVKSIGLLDLYSIMTIDNTMINGVTILETSDTPYGTEIRYFEDDVVDENGNLYLFESPYYPYLGQIKSGKRLISIYVGRYYYLIPVNGETFVITGAFDENAASSFDKSKAVKLSSPLLLNLPKVSAREIIEDDIKEIKYAVKNYGKYTAASVVGSIAGCILWIIVFGLIFIFTVVNFKNEVLLFISLIFGLVILITGFVFVIKFFKNIYLRNVLKKRYIKPVMFANLEKIAPISSNLGTTIGIYEWVDGDLKYSSYPAGIGTYFLPDDVKYGDIIYMLTNKAEQNFDITDGRIFCMYKEERNV